MTQVLLALTSTRGRSGKDTLIEELERIGHKVHRVAFGDVLKEHCAITLAGEAFSNEDLLEFFHSNAKDAPMPGLRIERLPETDYSRWLRKLGLDLSVDRTPRWHLQQYGTGFKRDYLNDPDIWLMEGLHKVFEAPKDHMVVITDLRQRNELVALMNLNEQGFLSRMVRIQRMWNVPGVDDAEYHVTDLDLIGFQMDAVVLNEWGSPEEMVTQLRNQGVAV